jgi:hypothetical protein
MLKGYCIIQLPRLECFVGTHTAKDTQRQVRKCYRLVRQNDEAHPDDAKSIMNQPEPTAPCTLLYRCNQTLVNNIWQGL